MAPGRRSVRRCRKTWRIASCSVPCVVRNTTCVTWGRCCSTCTPPATSARSTSRQPSSGFQVEQRILHFLRGPDRLQIGLEGALGGERVDPLLSKIDIGPADKSVLVGER